MGYGVLLFLAPPFCLIPPALLLGICFAVLYAGKSISKLKREEIANPKGSLLSLVFISWGIDIAALYVSLIIMLILSSNIDYFQVIHSEWGIAYENAYVPAIIYIVCWALLYAGLFSFNYFFFRKAIMNKSKRNKIFFSLIAISAIVWAALMCLLFLGIF